jgi:hypothetical protein
MSVLAVERVVEGDFAFRASAQCEVEFPKRTGNGELESQATLEIPFNHAARACADYQRVFDPDLGRWVKELDSRLTVFHADDRRPAWLRWVMEVAGADSPARLPRPVAPLAARMLQDYGPGSITVVQDPSRPVIGRIVAEQPGKDAPMFPARSYFDQYLVVRVGGKTYVNQEPLRVSSPVQAWPPEGETYRSEKVTGFYAVDDLDGDPVFTFGRCEVKIEKPLSEEERDAMEALVSSVRDVH